MDDSITPQPSDRIRRTLSTLQSLTPTERAAYLDRLREEQPSLFSQLDSLGAMGESTSQAGPLPETVVFPPQPFAAADDAAADLSPTSQIDLSPWRQLCDEFRTALDRGESPHIEDFLLRAENSAQGFLLEELIQLEVKCDLSEHVASEGDYLRRFPAMGPAISRAFQQLRNLSIVASDDTTRLGEWPEQQEGTCRVRPEELAAPPLVFADFEILREIARGGMGIVYEARQRSLNRRVALKMIRSGALADKDEVQRFRSEAEAAARLHHPQIVPVYEVGEYGGQHYFTMALIEGESLSVRLRHGPLPPREAARILRLVAAGVQYAHGRGVVHRDLKPGNILLDREEQPHVADFGLAKQIDQDSNLTVTGCVLGTPSFMPPEQARGEEAGPHSDIYSLGAILYAMLTNRPPFQAANAAETIQQVKEKDPVPPRHLNPSINHDLETICLKCLEKNPNRRYASAQALSDELDRFLGDQPIQARPVSSLERGWRWCVRHPARSALLLVSLLAVLALGFGVYFRNQSLAAAELAEARRHEILAASQLAQEREKLADTQRYHSLMSRVREGMATRALGWTWAAKVALAEANRLDVDAKDLVEFRSLVAASESRIDLRQVAQFTDVEPGQLAIDPKGTLLAITTLKGFPQAKIFVHELNAAHLDAKTSPRVFSFSTLGNFGRFLGGETEKFQERISALAFDPRGRWLVAGTRHGALHAWKLDAPGPPAKSWTAHPTEIRQLRFSPDGDYLYSTTSKENGDTKSWRVSKDFAPEAAIPTRAMAIGLTHDGSQLILADNTSLLAYDAPSLTAPRTLAATDVSYERFALSPVTGLLAGYISPNAVTLLDSRDGQPCGTLIDPYDDNFRITELQFTRSGLILAACDDDTVRVWDAASGELIASLGAGGQYDPVIAVSEEGHWLAVTNAKTTQLYEVRVPKLQQIAGLTAGEILDVEIVEGNRLKTLVGKTKSEPGQLAGSWLETWDVANGQQTRQKPLHLGPRGTNWNFHYPSSDGRTTRRLETARDGSREAVLTPALGPIAWDPVTNRWDLMPGPESPPFSEWQDTQFTSLEGAPVSASTDELASDDRAVELQKGEGVSWTIPSQTVQVVLVAIRVEAESASSPSEVVLETWVQHQSERTVLGRLTRTDLPHDTNGDSYFLVSHSELDAEGKTFGLTIGPGAEAVWVDRVITLTEYKRAGGSPVPGLEGSALRTLSLSSDGRYVWSLGKTEALVGWEAPRWDVIYHQTGTLESHIKGAGGFSTLESGQRWLLIGHRRGEVSAYATESGLIRGKSGGFAGVIEDIALSPDERLAAVGTSRGELHIIGVPDCTTRQILTGQRQAIRAVEFSPDGEWLVTGSRGQSVVLWQRTAAGLERFLNLGPFSSAVEHLRFSPDGRWLAVFIKGERAVRIWDMNQLRRKSRFE